MFGLMYKFTHSGVNNMLSEELVGMFSMIQKKTQNSTLMCYASKLDT